MRVRASSSFAVRLAQARRWAAAHRELLLAGALIAVGVAIVVRAAAERRGRGDGDEAHVSHPGLGPRDRERLRILISRTS